MHRTRPSEDPSLRWRRFCRKGRQQAVLCALLGFGGWALMFRIAPPPASAHREQPPMLSWWSPASAGAALDVRAQWTPAAFALSTPAGFSHALRVGRAGLAPPIHAARPATAFLNDARTLAPLDCSPWASLAVVPTPTAERWAFASSVFPPRLPAAESPRITFTAGWESRLFYGIHLDYSAWTNISWKARIEMRFDDKGVPTSMLLSQPSGVPEVDRRLARSVSGWRLLEPNAPRTGAVMWNSPASAAGDPP